MLKVISWEKVQRFENMKEKFQVNLMFVNNQQNAGNEESEGMKSYTAY